MFKNFFIIACTVIILGIIITGCSQPGTSTAVIKEQQQTQDDTKSLVDKIKSMGFNTNDYSIIDGKIIVEGDIAFDINTLKNQIAQKEKSSGPMKQYAHPYTVSPQRATYMTVYIQDNSNTPPYPYLSVPSNWASAIDRAINDWNNTGSLIHFQRVYSKPADIWISGYPNLGSIVAATLYPADADAPGKEMIINSSFFNYNFTDLQREWCMVHELGHALGLKHTNGDEGNKILIPGTPTSEPLSVMYPHTTMGSWVRFSNGDTLAIAYFFSLPASAPYVILYEHPYYVGKRWLVLMNDVKELKTVLLDKMVSSVQCFNGGQVYLFDQTNFNGNSLAVTSSISDLYWYGFDNAASSVLWNNWWQQYVVVYEHSGYRGKALVVRDSINSLSQYGFNDNISSVKCFNGAMIALYQHDNWNGNWYPVSGNIDYLSGFNDTTSSIAFVESSIYY